jgi:hypothetical protein
MNGQSGTDVRHPLSVEKELGVNRIQDDMKQTLAVRRMLKGPNCNTSNKAMFHARTNQGLKDRYSVRTSSLPIPLEGSIRRCTNYCGPLRSCSWFGGHDSCKGLRLRKFPRRWLPEQLSGTRKKSRTQFSRDLLQILEGYRGLESGGTATGDEP